MLVAGLHSATVPLRVHITHSMAHAAVTAAYQARAYSMACRCMVLLDKISDTFQACFTTERAFNWRLTMHSLVKPFIYHPLIH
jgi:hypothetical protein